MKYLTFFSIYPWALVCFLVIFVPKESCGQTTDVKVIFEKIIFDWLLEDYRLYSSEFDEPIYIDTNLIYHSNLYSDGIPIFKDENKICKEYGDLDFFMVSGKIEIPDSLRAKIFPINFIIDFEKDSFNYFIFSMPIWSEKKAKYVFRCYTAHQSIFKWRDLATYYLEFDISGKAEYTSCENTTIYFSSKYWSKKMDLERQNNPINYQLFIQNAIEADDRHIKKLMKSGND